MYKVPHELDWTNCTFVIWYVKLDLNHLIAHRLDGAAHSEPLACCRTSLLNVVDVWKRQSSPKTGSLKKSLTYSIWSEEYQETGDIYFSVCLILEKKAPQIFELESTSSTLDHVLCRFSKETRHVCESSCHVYI